MSNVIKSNFIYVTQDDKKVLNYDEIKPLIPTNIPGLGNGSPDGFKNIDYSNEAYKVEAVLKQESKKENERSEALKSSVLKDANEIAEGIIAEARQKAEKILNDAKEEADSIRKDNFEEAKNEGYAQGYDLAQRDVEELRQSLAIQLQANNEDYENKMCQLEHDMVDIVAGILENITGIEIGDKDVILHILHRTFNGIEHSQDYQIKVSADDYQLVNDNLDSFYECVREGSTIELYVDEKLEKNQCIIETDSNVIDCSLDEQVRNVCKELRMLSVD